MWPVVAPQPPRKANRVEEWRGGGKAAEQAGGEGGEGGKEGVNGEKA